MTHARAALACALATLLLVGCGTEPQGQNADPDQVDTTDAPDVGACRVLTPADLDHDANATRTVDCTERHTAETFAVEEFPDELDDADYDDEDLGAHAYHACSKQFQKWIGAVDESLVLRSLVTWAWFRPSEAAWGDGARWFRCDAVGGKSDAEELRPLPTTAKGLLLGRPDDRWLVCAVGPSIAESEKVPCSKKHDWRAVTTIKLGEPEDPYPGDEVVTSRTKAFCAESIEAWLNYPARYEYGMTIFHESEWEVGNRRSVCWAKTSE